MINFEQLFQQIPAEKIGGNYNIFTLAGKDGYAITTGRQKYYNSMIDSGGDFGLFFKKPTTWHLMRSDRYTLELIEREQTDTFRINTGNKCLLEERKQGGTVTK